MLSSQRDEMRGNQCAINSPRFTATSSRGLFQPPLLASSRAFKALLPARPIPLRTGRRLFSSLRIISIYFPTPCPPSVSLSLALSPLPLSLVPSRSSVSAFEPDHERGWIYSPFYATFFRPKRTVIYGDASINVATRRFEY